MDTSVVFTYGPSSSPEPRKTLLKKLADEKFRKANESGKLNNSTLGIASDNVAEQASTYDTWPSLQPDAGDIQSPTLASPLFETLLPSPPPAVPQKRSFHESSLISALLHNHDDECTIRASPDPQMDPFQVALEDMQYEISTLKCTSDQFCGTQAHVGALFHEKSYKRAPRLSQITADMVKGFRPAEKLASTTTMTIMWLHWCLWRWLLSPTRENFESLPRIMMPTAMQTSGPHSLATKFVICPTWRDWLCRRSSSYSPEQVTVYQYMTFRGPQTTLHALYKQTKNGHMELTRGCKEQAMIKHNWVIGSQWFGLVDGIMPEH